MNNLKGCVHCVCLTGSGRKRSCEEQERYIFLQLSDHCMEYKVTTRLPVYMYTGKLLHRSELRSSVKDLLVIQRTKLKTFTARSFSVTAPTLWNKLPTALRSALTLLTFKKDLILKFHFHYYSLLLSLLRVCSLYNLFQY